MAHGWGMGRSVHVYGDIHLAWVRVRPPLSLEKQISETLKPLAER
jgi:hypothetical protein